MRTTRAHASISKVLAAAGADLSTTWEHGKNHMQMSEEEELSWMESRKKSLARLRNRKSYRRGSDACDCQESISEVDEDSVQGFPASPGGTESFVRSSMSDDSGENTPRGPSPDSELLATPKRANRELDIEEVLRTVDVPADIHGRPSEDGH